MPGPLGVCAPDPTILTRSELMVSLGPNRRIKLCLHDPAIRRSGMGKAMGKD
jgi:hypothetical protein